MTYQPNEIYKFCLDPDLIKATIRVFFSFSFFSFFPLFGENLGNGIKKLLLDDRKRSLLVLLDMVVTLLLFFISVNNKYWSIYRKGCGIGSCFKVFSVWEYREGDKRKQMKQNWQMLISVESRWWVQRCIFYYSLYFMYVWNFS